MTARILPREQTGHRKAERTPKTLEALRELDGCSSIGQPRAVIAGPRRRP